MTFLTVLGVTEKLCSFKLVLEGKAGKEIHKSSILEFLDKNPAILLYQLQKTILCAYEYRRYSIFTFFENTINNSPKVLRATFLGSN